MAKRRPHRLPDALYVGMQRYFVTICCDQRRPTFENADARTIVLLHLRRTSTDQTFAVIAYCLMPDHAHLVAQGEAQDANLLTFMRIFKQVSGFEWKQKKREPLWQESFYDHVLRGEEDTRRVVRYVLENPVRAGIVAAPGDYEHSGSFVYSRSALFEWAFGWKEV